MTKRVLAWVFLTSVSSLAAQTAPTKGSWETVYSALMAQDTANAHGHSSVGFSPAIISIPGKPFSATRVYTDQRREDGSDIGDPVTAQFTIARDEEGRVHYEMAFEKKRESKLVIGGFDIQIYDPVAHTITRYFADADHVPPPNPIAKVRKLKLMSELSKPIPPAPPKQQTDEDSTSEAPQPSPATKAPAPPPPVEFVPTKDNLPVQSVDGIPVVIHRVILKYGNKLQFFQIDEDWLSPDYAIDMRRTTLRETVGHETVETKDIIPGQPDPSLFEVPPVYRIQREP